MALGNQKETVFGTKQEQAQTQQGAQFSQGANQNTVEDYLGLGIFEQQGIGSEYTNAFLEEFKKHVMGEIVKVGVKLSNKLLKFDRALPQFNNFDYSMVVVATKASNADRVYFHVVILEATGPKPLTASMIVEEIRRGNRTALYTASDAIYEDVLNVIVRETAAAFEVTPDKVVSTNATVIPYDQDPTQVAHISAIEAINSNIGRWIADTGIVKTFSIPGYLNANKTSQFNLDVTFQKQSKNPVGRVVRTDFKLDLKQLTIQNKSIMRRQSVMELGTTVGYTDFMFIQDTTPYGQVNKYCKPMIIVTETYGVKPTIDFSLLGILNATVFGNPNHLLGLVMNSDKDPGMLNFLVNKENKGQFGSKQKLKTGKLKQEDVVAAIRSLISPMPLLFIETEIMGPYFDTNAAFAALHFPDKAGEATNYIINVVEGIVGQKMVERQVQLDEGIVVPIGTYTDRKTGEVRDVRDIDLITVIEYASSPDTVFKYLESNLPSSLTGKDPYILRLEVFAELGIDAVINGKAVRVPLNPSFIDEFVTKATAAGYNPRTEAVFAGVNFAGYNDLQQAFAKYGNIGIRGGFFGGGYGQPMYGPQPNIHFGGFARQF